MKIKKFLLLALSVALLSSFIVPVPASICKAAGDSDVSTCADILEWHYTIMDGKVYRRLYNASTANWIGDWIYVCDYEG